jgi:hypothetical protein
VVWQDERGGKANIWGQFVSRDGELIDTNFPIWVSDTFNHIEPDVAFGDSNYLVVWAGMEVNILYKIWGRLVSREGKLIGSPFCICRSIDDSCVRPAVVWGKSYWFVSWEHLRELRGQLVLPNGTLKYSTAIRISYTNFENQYSHIAFDGTNYLLVWQFFGTPSGICGQLIDSVGNLDTKFMVFEGCGVHSKVACSGEGYLVVSDNCTSPDTIKAQRVSLDGSLIGDPIVVASDPPAVRGVPAIVWNGKNYLVAWMDGGNGDWDIMAQWISKNGSLIGNSFKVSSGWQKEYFPDIACIDTACLVVWDDPRTLDYDIWGQIIEGIGVEEGMTKPELRMTKIKIFPNPFVCETVVSCWLLVVRKNQRIEVKTYDLGGRLVEELKIQNSKVQTGGERLKIKIGKKLASGVYFVKVKIGNKEWMEKIVKIR